MKTFRNIVSKRKEDPAITKMSGILETKVGPPEEYGGSSQELNPEEMFVAAINSCIMLVFYHFVEKYSVDIKSYSSEAKGIVEKTRNGLRFTSVDVNAQVLPGNNDHAEKIQEITQLAERYCLVSNSVACEVTYNVEVNG